MRIHHLNCISTCPLGGRLMDGRAKSVFERGHLTCHSLLIENGNQLILVDTGLGLKDVQHPRQRLSDFFLAMVSPDFREEMTAVRQIERLGFQAGDVRHIILTHLDFDHAGGLDDFPNAFVHLMQAERDYAFTQDTWLDRQRYRPQQWGTRDRWRVYWPEHGESWFGFDKVQSLEGIPPEILMLPLCGHTFGHAGIAIRQDGGNWLLNAGDAYFHQAEMDFENPSCPPGLRFYQWMMEKDRKARLENQGRLRELKKAHHREISVFCSHDVTEFETLAARSAHLPAEPSVLMEARLQGLRTNLPLGDSKLREPVPGRLI